MEPKRRRQDLKPRGSILEPRWENPTPRAEKDVGGKFEPLFCVSDSSAIIYFVESLPKLFCSGGGSYRYVLED